MAGAIDSKTGEDQFTSLLEVLQQLDVLDRIIALTSDQGKDVCAAPTCAVVTVIVYLFFRCLASRALRQNIISNSPNLFLQLVRVISVPRAL